MSDRETCPDPSRRRFLAALGSVGMGLHVSAATRAATLMTDRLILAHYMPWFEASATAQHWGWHWTMNVFSPEKPQGDRRPIASHYYPLIGPYDSGDPDVLEYHALTMRLAGIDGVLIDWYGTTDHLDYAINHKHTVAMIDQCVRVGLRVAICYEDQTIPRLVAAGKLKPQDRISHARKELDWLRDHWFPLPAYVRVKGRPLLLSFGRDGLSDAEWALVLEGRADSITYLSEHHPRKSAVGAFDWPIPGEGTRAQEQFNTRSRTWSTAMPVAFPRFHDIYEQAKIHKSFGKIYDDTGETFAATLGQALDTSAPVIQLCTWNDWGEGTMIEPSREFGHRDLETVQRLRTRHLEPDFAVRPRDLLLPLRLFQRRLQKPILADTKRDLDRISTLLARRAVDDARAILDRLDASMPS